MWGKETLELEEITGALLSFNQRKKASVGVHKVKGLWGRVIKSVGKTSLGVRQVIQIEEKEEYSVLQVWEKRAHKTRMFRMEEKEHKK